jgi:multimeric flavodoxin WrbA
MRNNIKALGILGSPRKEGNTGFLLNEMLKEAKSQGVEVEKITIADYQISPCQECYKCADTGNCVIDDGMQEIYPKLLEADWVILASPIFFYGVTAQTKTLIDRAQALWSRKYLLKQIFRPNRKGIFVSVGGTRGDNLFNGAILTVKYFFDAIGIEYSGDLLFRSIDRKGDVKNHTAALRGAREMGKSLINKM